MIEHPGTEASATRRSTGDGKSCGSTTGIAMVALIGRQPLAGDADGSPRFAGTDASDHDPPSKFRPGLWWGPDQISEALVAPIRPMPKLLHDK